MKGQFGKLMILFVVLALCAPAQGQTPITIVNPSFELPGTGTIIEDWSQIDGWNCGARRNTGVEKNEYYSPVDGEWYAFHTGSESDNEIYQLTGHPVVAGETYTLKVWARSINAEGDDDATPVEVRLYYGSTDITSVTEDVNPVRLLGDPRIYPNDDGGNVWLDQGYRMEFAEGIFYQLDTADPLGDPWTNYNDSDYDTDMANGQIITSQGFKGLYSTYYEDAPPFYSEIWLKSPTGSPPDYTWPAEPEAIILSHAGDEDPWVIDAHLYQDDATGKLWMSWGGGTLWVSEMDPTDGELINHPADSEFDTHPAGTHTAVADWGGDEWSSDWVEGPAMYKHNGYYYYFGSYGDLAANYTIRGGRGTSPTGPFYDKDGVGLMEFDSGENEYGNTIFLGADGGQANPGHPHIWEESGTYYMGFDYTDEYDGSGTDRFGIRQLHWVDDWPTIYTTIEVTFNSNDYPDAIGQTLGISLRNTGGIKSIAAFDHVSLTYTGQPCTPTDCHVEALACGTAAGPKGAKYGQVTVTIQDDCGNPVVGADVTGTFTGDFNETLTETTDGSGQAVITTTTAVKKPTYQFCVDDVVHSLPYDETDNVVTCCGN